MKILINGSLINMTPELEAEWRKEMADTPAPEPTPEERIAALERSISSLKSSFSKFEAKLKYLNL